MKGKIDSFVDGSLDAFTAKGPVKVSGLDLQLASLDADEIQTFISTFMSLHLPQAKDSVERQIMLDSIDSYIFALRAIKNKLPGTQPTYVGSDPGDNELGSQIIRPIWFKKANTALTNWLVTYATAATYQDQLSGATAGKGYTLGQNFGLCITHLKQLFGPSASVSPLLSAIQIAFGSNNTLLPTDTREMQTFDNRNGVAMQAIRSVIAVPKTTLYLSVMADVVGTDNLALGGLVFGLGSDLRLTAGTWT